MRYSIFLILFACSATVHADVFKCTTRAGDSIFTDVFCEKGEVVDKVRPSESESDPVKAQQEVERQRAKSQQIEAENAAAGRGAPAVNSLPENTLPPIAWPPDTPLSPSSTYTH